MVILYRLIVLFVLAVCLSSCTSKVMGVKIEEQKTSYSYIRIIDDLFMVRNLESDAVVEYRANCNCDKDGISELKENDAILDRGLLPVYLIELNRVGDFFLEQEVVFNAYGKAVLSRIVDTNFDFSEQEKFAIQYHLLQAKMQPNNSGYSCHRFMTKLKSNS